MNISVLKILLNKLTSTMLQTLKDYTKGEERKIKL